jgi:hypothetical protein
MPTEVGNMNNNASGQATQCDRKYTFMIRGSVIF